jgi:hypothetical protein
MKFFKNPFKSIKMETNTPANEQETGDQGITTDATTTTNENANGFSIQTETTTENAVTEDNVIASFWRKIEEKESNKMFEITEAVETSQGVMVKVTIVYASNNVSTSMVFIPAVKIVDLGDGTLTIK